MNLHIWSPGFTRFGGGITAFSRELAFGLRDLGHHLRLFGKLDVPGEWQSFTIHGAGQCPQPLRAACFAALALRACARDRPDCVISAHLNYGPVAHAAKRLFGTRFALVAHGVDVADDLSRARRAALGAAERVLAVSGWTRQRLLGLGCVASERIAVLPNTVDESRFRLSPDSQRLADRYRIQPTERVLLTVARLDAAEGYKGYDRLLLALPAIRDACGPVRYLIVGEGGDRARLESMARELGVASAVTFAGFVAEEEMADHYGLADVFAMPSTGEGFGIVFLEAMACGTPVLAGDRDGSIDALDGGRLGRAVMPTDVPAIADGVIGLLRKQGPGWWFDRRALRDAVVARFGRAAFREALAAVLHFDPE